MNRGGWGAASLHVPSPACDGGGQRRDEAH